MANFIRSFNYFWPYAAKHFLADKSLISAADTPSSCQELLYVCRQTSGKVQISENDKNESKSHSLNILRGD
jgi:hypothetical protein